MKISTIFGVAPLAFATGAGAASRISIGMTVLGGMLVSTVLSLYVVPVFYVWATTLQSSVFGKFAYHEETPEEYAVETNGNGNGHYYANGNGNVEQASRLSSNGNGNGNGKNGHSVEEVKREDAKRK